jgi:arylsulfatase A-like enzyme
MDLYPTLLEATGIQKDGLDLDGDSLIPILTEKNQLKERGLFWHFPIYLEAYKTGQSETRDPLFRTRPGTAMRFGKWKLHYYFEDKEVELYDLDNDISEKNNLAESLPEKREELLGMMKEWWRLTSAPIPQTPNPEYQKTD